MRRYLALIFGTLFSAGTAMAGTNSDLLVSTTWLAQNLGRHGVTIVEVGDRATFQTAHIPGARFVAISDIAVDRNGIPNELPEIGDLERVFGNAGVRNRGRIVIYAHDIIPAARAFFTLEYLGADAAILDGGFAKWNAEKLPLENGAVTPKPVEFAARPHVESLVRIGQMRILVPAAEFKSFDIAVVDARPPEQYAGTEPGAGIARPGHIPGALSVPWNLNLTSSATPVFRSPEDLRDLYRDCGVPLDGSVVTYCRTGMLASVTYFVLRYIGTDVHLYDGSYAEWNCASGTSVWAMAPQLSAPAIVVAGATPR